MVDSSAAKGVQNISDVLYPFCMLHSTSDMEAQVCIVWSDRGSQKRA